ncbi:CDP-glucose 4,6-dehydratase [Sphingopyxis sp. H115]|uniref:CDP-glucose 4,6-dehydratase n=1 Tax=Sphingopyxis sp. H115 TaxID=1759073 RepID=UPI000ADB5025|nr:CDP-glucose 4,6-dehydratase [Sphingopyxis sp. H115]
MTPAFLTAFRGKRILVTGHTGFKGSWLSLWLEKLGANVAGYSLAPPTEPAMFDLCNIADGMDHRIGDIRDTASLDSFVAQVRPDVVFHLAAQPIVRQSYADPIETVTTNIVGTANVLEAVRRLDAPCAVVVVTSDKCYENREWIWGYREDDPMGGHDPYSMSKGATELVVASWRNSFFGPDSGVMLASGRAGNVIGGGDWAKDRIVPDCIRAFSEGRQVELRNPGATRPWQHVLEPLGGYLLLAERLLSDDARDYCSGWNFGPGADDIQPVSQIVRQIAEKWGGDASWSMSEGVHPKEAALLSLNCDKAAGLLHWKPCWHLEELAEKTVDWYRQWLRDPAGLQQVTLDQIGAFEKKMTDRRIGDSQVV